MRASEFIVENGIPTIGINVRNDKDIDYASLIVDGKKKYESRKTDSLRPYVGKTVGIVRTGNGPAVAIGQVTIGEPIIVDAEKFNKLRNQHLVPQGSKFDIDSDGTKYLYPMINPVRWDNEKPIKHKGIVSRKITEAKVSVKDQIINTVKRDGGRPEEYFVRFTDIDKLGFSARQQFGRSLDVDHPDYYPDYIGAGKGNPALWFYPLKTYISDNDLYAIEKPYVWLVRLKPNAWLQPVDAKTTTKQEAPQGKERVGMMKNIRPFPAAIFFKHGFDVVGKFYDYGSQHKRHGEVKGPSKGKPSFFDRVRGYT